MLIYVNCELYVTELEWMWWEPGALLKWSCPINEASFYIIFVQMAIKTITI